MNCLSGCRSFSWRIPLWAPCRCQRARISFKSVRSNEILLRAECVFELPLFQNYESVAIDSRPVLVGLDVPVIPCMRVSARVESLLFPINPFGYDACGIGR